MRAEFRMNLSPGYSANSGTKHTIITNRSGRGSEWSSARLDPAVGIYLRTTRVCATMSPRRLFFWEARTDMNATR